MRHPHPRFGLDPRDWAFAYFALMSHPHFWNYAQKSSTPRINDKPANHRQPSSQSRSVDSSARSRNLKACNPESAITQLPTKFGRLRIASPVNFLRAPLNFCDSSKANFSTRRWAPSSTSRNCKRRSSRMSSASFSVFAAGR